MVAIYVGSEKIDFKKIQSYYSREDIQKAIIEAAKGREVVSVFKDGRFGKRPDILQYPADIMQAVREGTISFHGSVERWQQPMKLDAGMTKQQLDELRSGWDVLIDVDVPDFEIAKAAVKQIIAALKEHGITSFGLKFTGGKSFHIIVPFESMPEKVDMKPTKRMYPEAMEKIIEYIKWYTTEPLRDELLSIATPTELAERVGKNIIDITSNEGLEPFKIVNMDIFGSRHMFRLPFSLHEKSLLVSLPIKVENIDKFQKADAAPEKVKVVEKFLIPEKKLKIRDAGALVVEAFDWAAKYMKEKPKILAKPKIKTKIRKIPESQFPPCIKNRILKGLADGRKRSVFILINFLRNMGWSAEEIEKSLAEWNEKNYPPLRANYIRSQLRWHIQQERNLLPPNCDNDNFYISFGVCKPDAICMANTKTITIKNPVNYAFRKMRREGKFGKEKKKGLKTRGSRTGRTATFKNAGKNR